MNTMKWLLRREFWEHKGGFYWTPIVVVGIMLAVTIGMLVMVAVIGTKHGMQIHGLDINAAFNTMSPQALASFRQELQHAFLSTAGPIAMVFSFVAFFYCLSALYDERRDRSILFWKSLPISDTQTVLSKLLTVLVVGPLLAFAAALLLYFATLLILLVAGAVVGVNLFGVVLGTLSIYTSPLQVLALLPLYALWALPAVGWLMLCSVWARTKPFLWAVGIPVVAGVLLVWFNKLFGLGLAVMSFWKYVVGRMLLSVAPGSWLLLEGPLDPTIATRPLERSWEVFASGNLWLGAIAGILMLVLAIRLRRWRDDG
jgi:ABC-2 type transport system permease protein